MSTVYVVRPVRTFNGFGRSTIQVPFREYYQPHRTKQEAIDAAMTLAQQWNVSFRVSSLTEIGIAERTTPVQPPIVFAPTSNKRKTK